MVISSSNNNDCERYILKIKKYLNFRKEYHEKNQLNKNILIMFTQCTCYMYKYHSFYSPVFLVLSFQKVLVLAYEALYKNFYTKIILHVHNYVLEIKIHVHFKIQYYSYMKLRSRSYEMYIFFHIGLFQHRLHKQHRSNKD